MMYSKTGFVQADFPTVLSFGQSENKEIVECKFFDVLQMR